MASVLAVVTPLWLIIGLGWLSARTGYVPKSAMPVIASFVLKVALPALMFNAMASHPLDELVNPTYVLVYAAGSVVAWVFGYAAMRAVSRGDAGRSARAAYAGMGASTSNSAFVGLPVMQGIAPQVAAPVFGMNLLVENLLTVPASIAAAEHGVAGGTTQGQIAREVLLRLLRTPMILAIIAGVMVSALGIPIPPVLGKTLTVVGQATTAPALFLIGATLVGQQARGRLLPTMPVVVGKLLVHPLAVMAAAYAVGALAPAIGLPPLSPLMRAAAIVSAAAPCFSILPVLAAQHGEEEVMTSAAFLTTLTSLITLTLVLLAAAPV